MGHFNRLFWSAFAIALLLLFSTPAFADVELYMQPPTLDGVFYASQNDVGGFGNFATVYDNFQIYQMKPYYLDDVEWFGGYWNGSGNVITGWTISIYADAGLQPGGVLWSQYFSVAHVGYMESCNLPNSMCAYDMDNIVGGYKLMPFTTYWISVVPDITFPPQWGWGTGMMGDNLSYQDFFGARNPLDVDMAFNVQGVTPEPGSMILLGTGILGLAGTLRRRLL
ncbi:MAG TPA: PEP-CTERM sorting domain-containing protein [Candidatus Eisenbacteria bacterium]|nr:PEP-CTERM sorting domain-containing protein [Candidatus Eisenbacteria bacterium]